MSKNPRDVVIVAAVRTAIGKAKKGSLKDTRPDDILMAAIKGAIGKVPKLDPAMIDDVVMGCAMPEGEQGMNVARIASLGAGIPHTVPAMTVNRFCSSGLQSLMQCAAHIAAGYYDIALTGGIESMTQIPMGGDRPTPNPTIMTENPGLYTPMGITSENVAKKFDVSREAQDKLAMRSHHNAAKAIAEGKFKEEIVPVETRVWKDGAWHDVTFVDDEGVRGDTSVEGLAKLRPAFAQDGTSTAGNSSQMSDGAAAHIIMAREKAEELGIPVMAVFRAGVTVGVPPEIMGIGPAVAIPKVLEKAELKKEDIAVFEINEAFASQAAYCVRELGLDEDKVNVNGGAIALGHPLGCTGGKLTATLLHELKRRKARYGVVSMCIGAGMGAAAVFENEN